jgi:hypothetical protein
VTLFPATKKKKEIGAYGPGFLHEEMVRVDVGLSLDDIEARTPDPLFVQCDRERVRASERAAGRVESVGEDSVLLHPAPKSPR